MLERYKEKPSHMDDQHLLLYRNPVAAGAREKEKIYRVQEENLV